MAKSKGSARKFVKGGEVTGREHRFQSGNAVFRRADPDNPETAKKQVNMTVDFSKNMEVVPNGLMRAKGCHTMNKGGKSSICLPDITVGSGTDHKGEI